jgi:hypothetical protein
VRNDVKVPLRPCGPRLHLLEVASYGAPACICLQ